MKPDPFAIQTRALTRTFGAEKAVSDVSLQVPAGSIYAFLGPNGAGKTTTIRMLLGLIQPTAGEVTVLGKSLARQRQSVLSQVGALVEAPSLYPNLSGAENLEIYRLLRGLAPAAIRRALETVGLADSGTKPVGSYSLGMRQRLAIGVALLGSPTLLVLDEPTNGLDPAGIAEVRGLVTRLAEEEGATVFLSSHILSEVEQVATHLGIIDHGRLVFQGSLAEFQAARVAYLNLGVDLPERAEAIIQQNGWQANPLEKHTLRVNIQSPGDAAWLNRKLVSEGVSVFHLSLEMPSLEEAFLTITKAG